MKRLLFTLLLLASLLSARAADRITATVTITNAPTTNGMTFVITTTGASTRTWTNSVVTPSVQILTNNTAPGVASNLQAHLEANPPAGVQSTQSSTSPTNLTISAQAGIPLTISGVGSYFSVSYATQAVSSAITVRVPPTVEAATTKTNVSSGLSAWLEDPSNTNSIDQNSFAASELVGLTNSQTVSGVKRFTGPNYHTNSIFDHGIFTNGVNHGQAFSSPGAGILSEQFGNGANASGGQSTALGETATASGNVSTALGGDSTASGQAATAVGNTATAGGLGSIAFGSDSTASGVASISIGNSSTATGDGATAIGYNATTDVYTNSTAIGYLASSTADNQIMLGSSGVSVYVNNDLTVGDDATVTDGLQVNGSINGVVGSLTNGTAYNPTIQGGTLQQFTAKWTNNFPANSDIAFTRLANSSLANGNNAGVVVGTNVFMEVSGPSGAFAINGITASPNRDGKLIIIENQTGQTMTIANESGVDATAGNRIRTGYGADITVTNNPGCVQLIYSGAASRWLIVSKTP